MSLKCFDESDSRRRIARRKMLAAEQLQPTGNDPGAAAIREKFADMAAQLIDEARHLYREAALVDLKLMEDL